MSNFSPTPSYTLGGLCLAMGVNAILRPNQESERFGLPPRSHSPNKKSNITAKPSCILVSPLIFLKGIREISYGAALMALEFTHQETAITIMATILSLVALGDGLVVWSYGGDHLRSKAFGHWASFVGFAAWSGWRFSAALG